MALDGSTDQKVGGSVPPSAPPNPQVRPVHPSFGAGPFTHADLVSRGFVGFEPFATLDPKSLPGGPGVYAFLRTDKAEPIFFDRNPSGRWKGKDPTVSGDRLRSKWLPEAECVYLGKAASLASRIDLMKRFAAGEPVMHWGGRLPWQVEMPYVLAWVETPGQDPRTVEKGWLREFSTNHGALPFGNLRH